MNLRENYKIEIILPAKYKKVGNEQILKMSIEKMYEQIANTEIEDIMEKTRKMLGIAPEDYEIRKMEKTLGKCEDGKITISMDGMTVTLGQEKEEYKPYEPGKALTDTKL